MKRVCMIFSPQGDPQCDFLSTFHLKTVTVTKPSLRGVYPRVYHEPMIYKRTQGVSLVKIVVRIDYAGPFYRNSNLYTPTGQYKSPRALPYSSPLPVV